MGADRTSALEQPVSTIGQIAQSVVEVADDTPALEIDELFLGDPDLQAVVARRQEGPLLISRQHFQTVITGRRGYGRALHQRRAINGVELPPTMVLPSDTSILVASTAMLGRSSLQRYDDVLVQFPDGMFALATATAVMKALAELFGYQASHDPLTGLGNRAQLLRSLEGADSEDAQIAVLYLDLDRFKVVNDSLGHAAGDQLLVEMGRRVASCLRDRDSACRIGGDEFVLVLRDVAHVEAAERIAQRLLDLVEQPLRVAGATIRLSTSVGVAWGRVDPARPGDLIRQADLAMYDAKAHGRGRYKVFGDTLDEHAAHRFALDCRLRAAVEQGQFLLDFQPMVDLATRRPVRYEALLRWNDPARGIVGPADFIEMAEETGLIVPIGAWVLRSALEQMIERFGTDPTAPGLAVNVSTRQLVEGSFVGEVLNELAMTGFTPQRLCLEITETAALHETDAVIGELAKLRAHGVSLSLDDFGTGYASLALLRRLPINDVKIDRSFVSGLLDSPDDDDLVRLTIEVAHRLGHRVTAEGIEYAGQAARLRALGCDLGQGFHFGRPAALHTLPRSFQPALPELELDPA